jgi:hypothetical protein
MCDCPGRSKEPGARNWCKNHLYRSDSLLVTKRGTAVTQKTGPEPHPGGATGFFGPPHEIFRQCRENDCQLSPQKQKFSYILKIRRKAAGARSLLFVPPFLIPAWNPLGQRLRAFSKCVQVLLKALNVAFTSTPATKTCRRRPGRKKLLECEVLSTAIPKMLSPAVPLE